MLIEQIKLESDENLIRIVRKHWFVLFKYPLFNQILPAEIFSGYTGVLWFFYLAWLLLIWTHFTNHITDYYLDLWVITDRRIVAIDQRGFFRRHLSSFRLERLQDMNIEVKGIIPTLLNYGTIEAQTAGGSNEEFKTANMPDPRGLKALIIKQADERQKVTQYRHDQAGL